MADCRRDSGQCQRHPRLGGARKRRAATLSMSSGGSSPAAAISFGLDFERRTAGIEIDGRDRRGFHLDGIASAQWRPRFRPPRAASPSAGASKAAAIGRRLERGDSPRRRNRSAGEPAARGPARRLPPWPRRRGAPAPAPRLRQSACRHGTVPRARPYGSARSGPDARSAAGLPRRHRKM